jgi:hypothetical protein
VQPILVCPVPPKELTGLRIDREAVRERAGACDRLSFGLDLLAYLNNARQEKHRVQRRKLVGDAEAVSPLGSQGLDGTGRHVAVQIQFAEFSDYGLFFIGKKGQFWKMRKNIGVTVATQVPYGCFQRCRADAICHISVMQPSRPTR